MTESGLPAPMRAPSAPTSDQQLLAAALASSLTASVLFVAHLIWIDMKGSDPMIQRPFSEFIVMFGFFSIGYLIFVLVLCAFPAIAFHSVARRFHLRHPIWYVPYGALLGAGFGLLILWIPAPSWIPDDQIGPGTIGELVANPRALAAWLMLFVVPGAVGGLTYWGVGRRRLPSSH